MGLGVLEGGAFLVYGAFFFFFISRSWAVVMSEFCIRYREMMHKAVLIMDIRCHGCKADNTAPLLSQRVIPWVSVSERRGSP